jgi:hypothetical protein
MMRFHEILFSLRGVLTYKLATNASWKVKHITVSVYIVGHGFSWYNYSI